MLINKLKDFVQKHGTLHVARPLSEDTVDSPGRASTSSSGLSPVCYSPISTSSETHSPSPSSSIFSPQMNSPLYFSHELELSPSQINDELHVTSVEVKTYYFMLFYVCHKFHWWLVMIQMIIFDEVLSLVFNENFLEVLYN